MQNNSDIKEQDEKYSNTQIVITDFYSWTIPKEKYLILGSALKPGKEAHEKFKLLKGKLQRYGFELNKLVKKEGAYLLRPTNRYH